MIQRIQSAFLLAATILSVVIIVHPISGMSLSDGSQAFFTCFGLKNAVKPYQMYISTYPIAVLAITTALISFITIFLFQRRVLQMRLCVYNILLTIGLIISIFIYYFIIKTGNIVDEIYMKAHAFSFSIVFPFVNIILLFQAFRSIRRDDMLIKSYDRLR
jgi:hypothetical protein